MFNFIKISLVCNFNPLITPCISKLFVSTKATISTSFSIIVCISGPIKFFLYKFQNKYLIICHLQPLFFQPLNIGLRTFSHHLCYPLLIIRNFPMSTKSTTNISHIIHFLYMTLNCSCAYP